MIQTNVTLPENPDTEVRHIAPDQLPYVCIRESLELRVDNAIGWHWHSYFEVAYVAEGSLECSTPDQKLALQQGEAVFINSGVLHTYKKTSWGPCVIHAHIFDSMFLSGTLSSGIYQKYIYPIANSSGIQLLPIRPENRHQLAMLESVRTMVELARKEPFGYEFQIQSQLTDFWCKLLTLAEQNSESVSRSSNDIQRIKTMTHYIHENYQRQICLQDIADAAAVSERECSRCFQRCFHETAITYLNKHRIRVAAGMLLQGHESISDISAKCGIKSVSYFGQLFQQMLGCSAREYRKKAFRAGDAEE